MPGVGTDRRDPQPGVKIGKQRGAVEEVGRRPAGGWAVTT